MSVVTESVGLVVAASLAGLAGYFVPAPSEMEAVFRVSAVASGLVGYWLSRQKQLANANVTLVFLLSIVILSSVPVLSILYNKYLHIPTPTFADDVLGFIYFELFFAVICFLLGLLYGNFIVDGGKSGD